MGFFYSIKSHLTQAPYSTVFHFEQNISFPQVIPFLDYCYYYWSPEISVFFFVFCFYCMFYERFSLWKFVSVSFLTSVRAHIKINILWEIHWGDTQWNQLLWLRFSKWRPRIPRVCDILFMLLQCGTVFYHYQSFYIHYRVLIYITSLEISWIKSFKKAKCYWNHLNKECNV